MRTKALISALTLFSLLVLGCGDSENFVVTNTQQVQNTTGNLVVNFSRTNITAQTTQLNFANADQYVVTLLDGNQVVDEVEVNADLTTDTQTVTFNNIASGSYTVVISSYLNGVLTDQVSQQTVAVEGEVTTTIGAGATGTFADFPGTFVPDAPDTAQTNGFVRVALLFPFIDADLRVLVDGNEVPFGVNSGLITDYAVQSSGTIRFQVQETESGTDLIDENFNLSGGQFVTLMVNAQGLLAREVNAQRLGNLDLTVITDDAASNAGEVRLRFVNGAPDMTFRGPLSLDAQLPGESGLEIEISEDVANNAASAYNLVNVTELQGATRLEIEDDQGFDFFQSSDMPIFFQTEEPGFLTYSEFVSILSGLQTSGGNVSVFFGLFGFEGILVVTIDRASDGADEGALFLLGVDT